MTWHNDACGSTSRYITVAICSQCRNIAWKILGKHSARTPHVQFLPWEYARAFYQTDARYITLRVRRISRILVITRAFSSWVTCLRKEDTHMISSFCDDISRQYKCGAEKSLSWITILTDLRETLPERTWHLILQKLLSVLIWFY